MPKIRKELEATSGKLQGIHESVSMRITGVEERVLHLENTVDPKMDNLEKAVDGKFVMMEKKINNLQSQRPESVRVVSESIASIKLLCCDGSSPLSVFKFQFEIVASRNGWDDDEKGLELILSLKGVAAEILETIPASRRNNYNNLMMALERKFDDEHIVSHGDKAQKANELLPGFAMGVERLVQVTYQGENHPLIDGPFW